MSYDMSDYVDVAERIREFRKAYPTGSLQPWNPDKPYDIVSVGERMFIVYTAAAYRTPDDVRPGIAVAWEPAMGRTNFTKDSELMNAETSAWGRAILATLAADSKRIASANEVVNRRADQDEAPAAPRAERPVDKPAAGQYARPTASKATPGSSAPTEKMANFLRVLMKQTGADEAIVCGLTGASSVDKITGAQCKQGIDDLLKIKEGTVALVFDTDGKPFLQ